MKGRLYNFTIAIVAIIILAAIGYAVFRLLLSIADAIQRVHWQALDPRIAAALIAGTISVIGIVVGQYLNRIREVRLDNRKKQAESYDNYLDKLFIWFNEIDEDKKVKLMEKLNLEFTQDVLLWSSNKVLKKFFEFKEFAKNNRGDGIGTLSCLENLIFAMRSDIGHRKKMKPGELLSIMFNESSAELKALMKR